MTTTRDRLFPKELQLAAQHSERETGVPACLTLAQYAWESNFGKSLSGNNNPFGIKGNAQNGKLCNTWEEIHGRAVKTKAYFRNFKDFEDAFNYHGRLLANPKGPYKNAIPFMNDWEKYTRMIAHIYATDSTYADKIIGVINRYKLYELNLPKGK